LKDPQNNNKLIIDMETAGIIRRIYEMYLNGKSVKIIADILNDEGVECPSAYKKRVFPTYKSKNIKYFLWSREKIRMILRNATYCGNLTQRKAHKISYKIDKTRKIPTKEWITAEGTHEGIVSVSEFENVQTLLNKKANNNIKRTQKNRLLNGLIFCKECGGKMTYRGKSPNYSLLCLAYSRFGLRVCHSNAIREDFVENLVIDDLRNTAKQVLSADFCKQFDGLEQPSEDGTGEQIKAIKAKLDETRQIIKNLYVDKLKGVIDESILFEVSSQYTAEMQSLNNRLAELEQQHSAPATDYKSLIKQIANFDTLDKSILLKLIDKIEICKEKKVHISYNFKNPLIAG
jgi:hypothetical protein